MEWLVPREVFEGSRGTDDDRLAGIGESDVKSDCDSGTGSSGEEEDGADGVSSTRVARNFADFLDRALRSGPDAGASLACDLKRAGSR